MSLTATRSTWSVEFPKRFTIQRAGVDVKVRGASVKFVALCLADHANDKGNTWPSCTTIARETGLDRKTVLDAIAILISVRLITPTGLRKHRVPVFRFTIDELTHPVLDATHPENGTSSHPENGTQNLPVNQSRNDGRAASRGTARRPSAAMPSETRQQLQKMGVLKK